MISGIRNNVKISQLIQSQLPEFISDDISVVEPEIISSGNSGTYNRSERTITIQSTNHGLIEQQKINVTILSGYGSSGFYNVKEVLDNNNFTIYDDVFGSTSGSLNFEVYSGFNLVDIVSSPGSYAKFIEFLKQYYISQEFQGGPVDIIDNLNQYLSLDNLVPEVLSESTALTSDISFSSDTIHVNSTKGYPSKYGLLKIDDEIITYISKTPTSFLGCIRGFSAITNYHNDINKEELVFSTSDADSHLSGESVENLSILFLKEFYNSVKYSLSPGLENKEFTSGLNVGNFLKESRSLYESKGTEQSFKILFRVLFGSEASIIDLEQFLIKPSWAKYIRREIAVADVISGNPINLKGQNIFKNNDTEVTASISDIQIFARGNQSYYRIYLFIGYDNSESSITGNFDVTPSTRCASNVAITTTSSEVITVDSTVGFEESGFFFYEENKVLYTDKTVNQFLGCYSESVPITLEKQNSIVSSETYYGYENGDLNKRVDLRFTGVLSGISFQTEFEDISDKFNFIENDEIFVKSLGEIIDNPTLDEHPTKIEILSNSWIYNTNCRIQIDRESIIGDSFNSITNNFDKSNIKVGDKIEILERGTNLTLPGLEELEITFIDGKKITVNNNIELSLITIENKGLSIVTEDYDLRRIQETASISSSSLASIKYGQNKILSNVLNVYKESEENLYVASNSLPEYEIDPFIYKYEIEELPDSGFNIETEKYSIVQLSAPTSLLSGDRVKYVFTEDPIEGFNSDESYYIEIISDDKKQIRLYSSLSLIGTENYLEIGELSNDILPSGDHGIILFSQSGLEISPQKALRKFKVNPDIGALGRDETLVGPIGMMINGVEIISYKSNDKVYYGPIKNVNVLNSGDGYDVINPPLVEFSTGDAKVQPVISGSFEKVFVSKQEFAIGSDITVSVSGGNGEGAVLVPVLKKIQREVNFDARLLSNGGGVDIDIETISFPIPHNFSNGEKLIYDSNGNAELGIYVYQGSNLDFGKTLVTNSTYFASVFNDQTIQLYETLEDFSVGINTIGFTNVGNSGIHKFKTLRKNTLSEIAVSNGGSGYTNRKLRVKPSGISSSLNTINFENHGFSEGELIEYECENIGIVTCSAISGLSTNNSYYIINKDNDSFQLSNAGIGGTSLDDYERGKIVSFKDTGVGYQIFKYPDISLNISYSIPGIGTTAIFGTIDATPVVRGGIEQIYVYESGSDYGRPEVVNLKISPKLNIINGNSAQFRPIISSGQIIKIQVQYGGVDYYSYPDVVVVSNSGSGAILKPVVRNNKIVEVEVLNGGLNYDVNDTTVIPISSGLNASFQANIRDLTLNKSYKLGTSELIDPVSSTFYRKPSDEVIDKLPNNELQYGIISYSSNISSKLNDTETNFHSPIIGWAYDGNPIYGSYGYSDPDDTSSVKQLQSGYVKTIPVNRPNGFDDGFFIEDFIFDGSGDLDIYNGRFCKTPEFPNGVYAYFATVMNDVYSSSNVGRFPYFIGKYFRSPFDKLAYSEINQGFDFNNSDLIRNTLPYKSNDPFAGNDYIIESNELQIQKVLVESVENGRIDRFRVAEGGDAYKVGDRIIFNESEVDLISKVSEIRGKEIVEISTTVDEYDDVVLVWKNDNEIEVSTRVNHNLEIGDTVILSGVGTDLFSFVGNYKVGLATYSANLRSSIDDFATTGEVTTIGLNYLPQGVSVGSSIRLESEIVSVLNVYPKITSLRILRPATGIAHTDNTIVELIPNNFTISKNSDYFNSKLNYKVYFNPSESVGLGTTPGVTRIVSTVINETLYRSSVPTQAIYIQDHQFKTNQKVIFKKQPGDSSLSVRNDTDGIPFLFPDGNEQICYVINQSQDRIGLVTAIGLTTTSNGLFFTSAGTDSYLYSIETNYKQETGKISRIKSTIITESNHLLLDKDKISLNVRPSSTGTGTTSIIVKFDPINELLFTDEVNISSGINTANNTITLEAHEFINGQKVYYDSSDTISQGLSTGYYYISKIDDDVFGLSETFNDTTNSYLRIVSIGSTGGSGQTLSRVNPKVTAFKNRDLIFDLSDSSLVGYNFNIYYNNEYAKEFLSVSTNSEFNVIGVGTPGEPDSKLTLQYSDFLPEKLFYNVEKNGFISTSDKTTKNYTEIEYIDSKYFGNYEVYNVSGIGSTVFNISLAENPEQLSYSQSDCDVLEYYTSSKNSDGSIYKIRSSSGANFYNYIPSISGFTTTNSTGIGGEGALIIPESKKIGNPKEIRILNSGFDYPSDKTLRPTAAIPYIVELKNNNIISRIDVISGGNKYLDAPNPILLDPETFEEITTGIVRIELSGFGVQSAIVEDSPKGLKSTPAILKCIDNSNGITIDEVQSSPGVVTCILTTPFTGFITDPFATGDKIFVEGIQKEGEDGDGFNSADYNYQFFDVINYNIGSNPGILVYSLSGLTTNPGIAKTIQDGFPSAINSNDYPVFSVVQEPSPFFTGETIFSDIGFGYEKRDLIIKNADASSLRLFGTYDLVEGEIIRGQESFYEATVENIKTSSATFNITAYNNQRLGWSDEIGKLSEDFQVIENNDYYQNLSYSIKSDQTWNTIVSSVNDLLHTSGLKNFSDTQFEQSANVNPYSGIGTAEGATVLIVSNNVNDVRVDTINNFDCAIDVDIFTN